MYGADQGLTNPTILSLQQDREGFLWASTEGGLFRYDGDRFRPFPVRSAVRKRGNATSFVTLAVNGLEACRCYLKSRFDLVLMDVQMPEMDGLEATRHIRAEELRSSQVRTPILALTAHASSAHRKQCLAEGMDGVITKPVGLSKLLLKISAAMECSDQPNSRQNLKGLNPEAVRTIAPRGYNSPIAPTIG